MSSDLSIEKYDVVTSSSSNIDRMLYQYDGIEIKCTKSKDLEQFDKDLLFDETDDTFTILQKDEFKLEQSNSKSLNLYLNGFVHKLFY